MGYELQITRAEDWTRSQEQPIEKEEWLALIRSDPEFQLNPRFDHISNWRQGGWVLSGEDEGELTAVLFRWQKGCLRVEVTDRPTLKKMLELALKLGARVQGEDGEIYRSADDW